MRVVSSRNISTTQTWFWNLNGCVLRFFYKYWGVPEFSSWLWLFCGVNRQTLFERRIGFLSIFARFSAVRQWERIVCGFSISQAHVCFLQVLPLQIFFSCFFSCKTSFALLWSWVGEDLIYPWDPSTQETNLQKEKRCAMPNSDFSAGETRFFRKSSLRSGFLFASTA